jgi:hypothetical protein
MKRSPQTALTIRVSVVLALVAFVGIVSGYHLIAAIAGVACGVNMIAGAYLPKY